jgi:hypothetical protein
MKRQFAIIGLFLVLTARAEAQAKPEAEAPAAVAAGAGYRLQVEKSRFSVGAGSRRETEGPYERIVGDKGAVLIDMVTGATLAVPTSPTVAKGTATADYPRPLTNDPEKHSAAVREYLLGMGVPAAQVGGTHVTTTMGGAASTKEGLEAARLSLLWYTTHLDRSLAGIPVEGSFAFAALDSESRVISEGLYWPAIPSGVIQKATDFRRRLDAEQERTAFLDRVRAALSQAALPEAREIEGELRIVHTSAGHHGAFEARAVYNVIVRSPNGGKPRILRFDETGALVTLADERPSGTDSRKRR